MNTEKTLFLTIGIVIPALFACATNPGQNESAIVFEAASGEEVAAIEGSFEVLENRANPASRTITLRYVRFPKSENKSAGKSGAPIVYLAGGPGGSGIGTAERQRFPLFMAMREFGDVIAFDQRGTGASEDTTFCESSHTEPDNKALSDGEYAAVYRDSIPACVQFWREKGIDLAGYTTVQSVQDLDSLRRHLGADKLTLWGTSYGSHLALAALKAMDDRIERVVISSAEGLDQTVKLPARTDAYFDRVQTAIDTQAAASKMYPDIRALMARVHGKLEKAPVTLRIPQEDGSTLPLLLTRSQMQRFASWLVADPDNVVMLLGLYAALDNGDVEPMTGMLARYYQPSRPISWRPMPLAMDVASGISDARLATVQMQAKTALLGAYLNFPMPQIRTALPELDLGDDFRTAPVSAVPTLLLSGTLDGRTYVESQLEATAGLSHRQVVTVVNAGHNLFMSSPEVTEVIQSFMRGKPLARTTITVPLPDFVAF